MSRNLDEKTAQEPIVEQKLRQFGLDSTLPEVGEVDVLVVDDEKTANRLLVEIAEKAGHPVQSFLDPEEALDSIRERPPQILITDLVMPGLTGIELAQEARRVDPDIGVLVITASGEPAAAAAANLIGSASYLTKPISIASVQRALQRLYLSRSVRTHQRAMLEWTHEQIEANAAEIRDVTMSTLSSLMNAMDARSPHFRGHSRAVALQAAAVAQTLGMPEDEVEQVRTAGLLHDIGMIGIPDSIVDKPSDLTEAERDLIRTHCAAGVGIVEPMNHLGSVVRYVGEHHERFDGTGYPLGLAGDQISKGGQVLGIAEAWVGILESRAYRKGRTRNEAFEILFEHQGEWFSSDVTEALVESDVGVIG